jgi:hypothetical protein
MATEALAIRILPALKHWLETVVQRRKPSVTASPASQAWRSKFSKTRPMPPRIIPYWRSREVVKPGKAGTQAEERKVK